MFSKRQLTTMGVSALLVGAAIAAWPVAAKERMEVKLLTHIQMDLPEQDVFVESASDATKVVRVEGAEAKKVETLAKKGYASTAAVPHDPLKVGPNPLGPFPKGAALDFTLGKWLDGTGSGGYTVDGDEATVDLSMQKLVPNATYTLWCSRLKFPPNPSIVDKPCGKADGSENVFKTDASGKGTIHLTMPALEPSTKEVASLLALAYHSDGKTYGSEPGEFGLHTHVQLAWLLPAPAAATTSAASSPPTTMPTTGLGDDSIGWAYLVGACLAAMGLLTIRRARSMG